jgi:hypothetical protein
LLALKLHGYGGGHSDSFSGNLFGGCGMISNIGFMLECTLGLSKSKIYELLLLD